MSRIYMYIVYNVFFFYSGNQKVFINKCIDRKIYKSNWEKNPDFVRTNSRDENKFLFSFDRQLYTGSVEYWQPFKMWLGNIDPKTTFPL